MPVSTQMGHSYTSYNFTDHMLGPIRRLGAELSNLFTPHPSKGSVDNINKCTNVNCPSNPKTGRPVIFQPAGRYSGNAGKTALTRRKSCPVGASNIVISRPWHSSKHKLRGQFIPNQAFTPPPHFPSVKLNLHPTDS